jgi:hypothetical protein
MADAPARAAERLAREMDGWKSIEFRSHEELVNDDAANDPHLFSSAKTLNHYVETASGRRLLEQQITPARGKEIRSTYYCDGKRSADFMPRKAGDEFDHVLIKPDFGIEASTGSHWCPEPLFSFYHGPRPLHQALATAEYLGVDTHLGRECESFLIRGWKSAPASQTVYSLDRTKAIPLRVRYYHNEADRVADRPYSTWNALAVEEIEGHLMAVRSEQIQGNPARPSLRQTIVVDEIHFHRDYPESTFWPKIGAETNVTDGIRKTVTHARSSKPTPSQADGAGSGLSPIRAVESEGWGAMIPGASLAMGAALLLAGAALWLRRRAAG